MSETIVYDKNNNRAPSEGYLSLLLLALRRSNRETELGLLAYLETFNIDPHDNEALSKAIHEYKDELYPPKEAE